MKTPICLLLHMEVPPRLRPDLCRSRLHLLPEYAAYFPHVLFMVSEAIPKTCSMQRKMVTGCGQLWMLWGAGTIRKSADLSGKDMVEMVDRSPPVTVSVIGRVTIFKPALKNGPAQLCNPRAKGSKQGSRTVVGFSGRAFSCHQSPAPEIETQQIRCWDFSTCSPRACKICRFQATSTHLTA